MLRYFITQHPTFGRSSTPTASSIEKSPYYYWWLALTLNDTYTEYCEKVSVEQNIQTETTIHKVYEDFGDVRYEGDRYIAFKKWWRSKANDNETRGEFLFAEPLTSNKVRLIEDSNTANEVVNDESNMLISIPKTLTRRQIDKGLEKILKQQMTFERGRQTVNPSRSNARYSLTKPIKVDSLKTAFDLQELVLSSKDSVSNFKLSKLVGIKVSSKEMDNIPSLRRKISVAVSRKKRTATDAIDNVIEGQFP
jgi:hypothetical protein